MARFREEGSAPLVFGPTKNGLLVSLPRAFAKSSKRVIKNTALTPDT